MDVARRCWMVLEGCEVSWHSLELKEVMWPLGGQATQRRKMEVNGIFEYEEWDDLYDTLRKSYIKDASRI
ncbi:hypothetical protein Tco_0077586 [Tanacetum coccineum]